MLGQPLPAGKSVGCLRRCKPQVKLKIPQSNLDIQKYADDQMTLSNAIKDLPPVATKTLPLKNK